MPTKVIFASDSPISAATRASTPRSFFSSSVMRQSKTAVQVVAQTTSIQRSGSSALAARNFAIHCVDRDALVALELADDVVARYRQAALRELYGAAFAAVNCHRVELVFIRCGFAREYDGCCRACRFAFGQTEHMTRN